MRGGKWHVIVILAVVAVVGSCTPEAIPVPTQRAVPDTLTSVAPALTPEETAWNKVVQAAKKEGKLTLYSFSLVGDFGNSIARAFKDTYGIDLDIVTGRGAEFVERLKTEKRMGNMTGDVMDGAPVHALNLKAAGITVPIPELPVLNERDVWLFKPLGLDRHMLGWNHLVQTFYVNTNLVKVEGIPISYNDILNPRWNGKIVYPDPNVSSTMYSVFLTLINRGVLKPNYIDELAKQKPKFSLSNTTVAQELARGNYPLGMGASKEISSVVAEGAPIRVAPMKEGNVTQTNQLILVKDSPHPNAAQVYANWYLSREGIKLITEKGKFAGVRKDVPSGEPESVRTDEVLIPLALSDYDINVDAFNKKLWVDKLKGQ